MAEQDTPKGPRPGLAIFIIVAVIAAGWYYFQNLEGGSTADSKSAVAEKEKMQKLQKQAKDAYAPTHAAELFKKAMEAAERGDHEFDKGNFKTARNSYASASGYFQASIDKGIPRATADENATNTQQSAAADAKKVLLNLQYESEKAGAPTLAAADYKTALQSVQQGDRKYKEGNYVAALHAYQEAGGFFRTSRDKANKERLRGMEDIGMIKGVVESIRQEMLREKAAAEQAKSETWAKAAWENAREKEQAGDINFQKGDKNGYLTAQELYADAKDRYRNAKEQANNAAIAAADSKDKAARTVQLRNEAENARSAMAQAKRNISGNTSEKESNTTYQKASGREADGDAFFRSGDYQSAEASFKEAKNLYNRAGADIQSSIKEKADVAEAEKAKEQKADSDIQNLVSRFEQSFKVGDVGTLATFKEDVKGWEKFFKNVEDVKVHSSNIEEKRIFIENGSARVSIKVNISYRMKGNTTVNQDILSRKWNLRWVNGNWLVESMFDK